MYGWIVVLSALCLWFAVRYYLLKREMKRLTVQIGDLGENARYGQRLYLEENNRTLSKAVLELNRLVDGYEQKLRRVGEMERNIRLSVSGISHDLRTPLTSLAGYVQLLNKDPSPDKQREYVRVILDSVNVLQQLTESFYELSRLELEETSYAVQSVNLEHAVAECFLRFFEEFSKRNLELDIRDAAAPPVVLADPVALQRVIHNLIQNLLRYAHGTISVSFTESGGCYAVTIGNKTAAPLPDDADLLFDRFHKSDASRGGQGMGLGLYISRKLMNGMGGSIGAVRAGDMLFVTAMLPKEDGE
ncbi:sensor histidine kinase [Paenibacillus kobensis]|uniref:sensor histidine kinase n=1 Tax=Paenibacillus kobensis TaxID=59841 RepID=UPI000FD99A4A|nr:HAMP domain-containing sensor histidine kinase [Paenibacillus kobensis]